MSQWSTTLSSFSKSGRDLLISTDGGVTAGPGEEAQQNEVLTYKHVYVVNYLVTLPLTLTLSVDEKHVWSTLQDMTFSCFHCLDATVTSEII